MYRVGDSSTSVEKGGFYPFKLPKLYNKIIYKGCMFNVYTY